MTKLAVTGHRPKKLYPLATVTPSFNHWLGDVSAFAATLLSERRQGLESVLCGMAEGFDMGVATACVQLDIPFTAVLPFEGQHALWSGRSQEHYRWLREHAHHEVIVSQGRFNIAYEKRDRWMVESSTEVLGLWDGSHSGTGTTMGIAAEWCIPRTNVWDRWLATTGGKYQP